MAVAQRMLFEVDLRPGEIAEAVGYPDICQFFKQFKKASVSVRAHTENNRFRELANENLCHAVELFGEG